MGYANTLSLSPAGDTVPCTPHLVIWARRSQRGERGVDFAPRGHSALTGAIFVTVGEEGATGTQ